MIIQTEKGQEARRLFESGYNCAQSVAGAFAEEMGLPRDTVFRLASPFGGGMGRMREVCGAVVSGMMMVLGILDGYCSPTDLPEKKKRYIRLFRSLPVNSELGTVPSSAMNCWEQTEKIPTQSRPNALRNTIKASLRLLCRRCCQHTGGIPEAKVSFQTLKSYSLPNKHSFYS